MEILGIGIIIAVVLGGLASSNDDNDESTKNTTVGRAKDISEQSYKGPHEASIWDGE